MISDVGAFLSMGEGCAALRDEIVPIPSPGVAVAENNVVIRSVHEAALKMV